MTEADETTSSSTTRILYCDREWRVLTRIRDFLRAPVLTLFLRLKMHRWRTSGRAIPAHLRICPKRLFELFFKASVSANRRLRFDFPFTFSPTIRADLFGDLIHFVGTWTTAEHCRLRRAVETFERAETPTGSSSTAPRPEWMVVQETPAWGPSYFAHRIGTHDNLSAHQVRH